MPQEKWNYNPFWDEVVSRMQSALSEQESITWLNRISYAESKDHKLILAVPSLFIRDYVSAQYKATIQSMLNELTGEQVVVDFIVKKVAQTSESSSIDHQDQSGTAHHGKAHNSSVAKTAAPMPKAQKRPRDPNINNSYQFETFVVGDNSAFAYNVSMAIAKNPGVSYNPCLIYGGVGLGKTHLIQSIGNYIQDNTPNCR